MTDETEDFGPGHNISDSSEGLLPGGGGARLYRSCGNKGQVVGMSKGYRYLKKTRHLKLRGLALWLTGIILLMCTSALRGQYPVLSHPESPQVHHQGGWGVATVAEGLMAGILSPS